jgi:hypothetical protein
MVMNKHSFSITNLPEVTPAANTVTGTGPMRLWRASLTKVIFILGLVAISTTALNGQNVEFTASAPAEVAVGERFRLTYQVNTRPVSFNAPDFSNVRIVSGPNQSSSTSMQIINNRTTVTESFTYTYILEATQEGSLTIPAARITVEGNTHTSNPVTINVRAASAPPSPGQTQPAQAPPGQASSKDVYIRASASTTNPYQGQQVIVTYNIYTRIPVNQYSIDRLPSFRNLWSENLTQQGQPQARTQIIDGETYRIAEIYRVAVFPQRSGELTIEPLEAELVVTLPGQRRQSLFDEFFGGSPFDQRRNVRQNVRSNAVTLNVKPLPVQNRPAAFSGIVGSDFDVKASINLTQLNVNDAANLRIAISGKGNIKMVEKPSVLFPPNLEVFDPNVSDNLRNSVAGVAGTRNFEYVMIPRTGGEFTIPTWSFVYFDPAQERYISASTPEFVLTVSGDARTGSATTGIASQEAIRTLATDIRFIKTSNIHLLPMGKMFFNSNLFWALFSIPFILFAFFIVLWRNHIKLHNNHELLRNKKAEKLARKRLKKAKTFLDKNEENSFYDEIFRALWGYLSDKLSIPVSILNKENVEGAFKVKKVSAALSESFISTLNDCEFARFAPGPKDDRMAEIYKKAHETIVTIEKELRNKKVGI